jgi:hypothetical protein
VCPLESLVSIGASPFELFWSVPNAGSDADLASSAVLTPGRCRTSRLDGGSSRRANLHRTALDWPGQVNPLRRTEGTRDPSCAVEPHLPERVFGV